MPTLRRLTLEDCSNERLNFHTYAGHGGQYELFKATAGKQTYLTWTNGPYTMASFIQVYLSSCSTLTKLEICIEFLWHQDDALDPLSLPSLTSLAIVPRTEFNVDTERWSWGTIYRILKSSPNITCFRFEYQASLYPFSEFTSDWKEYKRRIGNLPLSQLSSITAYRQLVKRLVPGRPVSFVKILLFSDNETYKFNWPDPDSDDEVNGDICHSKERYIVPYQLVRSATPIKTLYLQRINERVPLDAAIWAEGIEFLRDACPYVTDLWIPSLKTTSRRPHYRDPVVMAEVLDELRIWDEMTLERCAVGPRSPCLAKELAWYREGTVVRRRVHPTLKELLLGVDVLWKWHDDSEVTGWVLYVSTDIER